MNPSLAVTQSFPGNTKNYLGILNKSPTFAMSLGAKELFHTNFLALLLESQDSSIENIQTKLKELLFGHNKVGRVITWREKESLDLVIMLAPQKTTIGNGTEVKNGATLDYHCASANCKHPDKNCKCPNNCCDTIAVVIEAKLKSIPTQQQLDGYDEKLMNGIDFELDEVDTVDVSIVKDDARNWQVMRLKIERTETCKSTCTIEARGKKDAGGTGGISEFKGKVRRILLRPLRLESTCSDAQQKNMGCWEQMNWHCVVDALKCEQHEEPCVSQSETTQLRKCKEAELLSRIICDYRDSLEQLLSILNKTEEYVETSVSIPGNTYGCYYKAITDKKFKSSRIHDLVGKYASHILEQHVKKFLDKALNNTGGDEADCADGSSVSIQTSSPLFNNFKPTLNCYTHFSNSQPGVAFEWQFSPPKKIGRKKARTISVGVQLQGTQYRHFIAASGGTDIEQKLVLDNLAEALNTNSNPTGSWFCMQVGNPPQENYHLEMKKTKTGNIEFFVFGKNTFRYTSADISDLSLPDLDQAVCRSLCIARQFVQKSNGTVCSSLNGFLQNTNPQLEQSESH